MRYLSVCSGIEAASVAWHPLGWRARAVADVDAFANAVTAHHYPDVPNLGDMTKWPTWDKDILADADVLVGGTPCQAFSVAGLRKSLGDDRGNLSLEFIRLADSIDAAREAQGRDPSVVVWENVPGVLSVKDNAFGCFLAGLAGDVDPYVPPRGKWTNAGVAAGPARTVAWRVLDAQYFGLAQRRRRVFVVASARDGFDPAAVLLEFEGLRRDSPPRRETGKTASGGATGRAGERSHWDGVDHPHPTLNQSHNTGGVGQSNQELFSQRGAYLVGAEVDENGLQHTVGTLCADTHPGAYSGQDAYTGRLVPQAVTHALRGEGFDASKDGTGRGTPLVPVTYSTMPQNSGKDYKAREVEVAQPIMAGGPVGGNQGGDYILQPVAIPVQEVGKRTGASTDDPRAGIGIGEDGDPMYTLQAGAQHGVAYPLDLRNAGRDPEKKDEVNRQGVGVGEDGDPMHTISTAFVPGVAYAFQPRIARNGRGDMGEEVVNALQAQSGETGNGDAAPCVAICEGGHGVTEMDTVPTLQHAGGGKPGQGYHAVRQHMAVRRLTPEECESLQGFPRGYTNIPWRGKPEAPDGPRYKALGNSMAVPVMAWIGKRIAEALRR